MWGDLDLLIEEMHNGFLLTIHVKIYTCVVGNLQYANRPNRASFKFGFDFCSVGTAQQDHKA